MMSNHPGVSRGKSPVHENSGCAARSARMCPGISISGTTRMPRPFAYERISATSFSE